MLRVPKYRASLLGHYREHLPKRRAEDPGVPVTRLFEETKILGLTGCLNLLHKYINRGRAIRTSGQARRRLPRDDSTGSRKRDFALLLTPHADVLTRAGSPGPEQASLPHLHAFTRSLDGE